MARKEADRLPYRSIDALPELATPEEVAEVFRCSSRYIKNECAAGKMAAAKVAGKFLISREEARAYLDRARVAVYPVPAPGGGRSSPPPTVSPEVLDQVRTQMALEAAQRLIKTAKARRREPK